MIQKILSCAVFLWTVTLFGESQTFERFRDASDYFSAQIKTAHKRVWLQTEHLSDTEVAKHLFFAHKKDLDIRVVIHKENVDAYNSKYRFLTQERIDVVPTVYKKDGWSYLLVDSKLFRAPFPVHYLHRADFYPIERVQDRNWIIEKLKQFLRLFYSNQQFRMEEVAKSQRDEPKAKAEDPVPSGPYHYNTQQQERRPAGVPTRLPKTPKYQGNR